VCGGAGERRKLVLLSVSRQVLPGVDLEENRLSGLRCVCLSREPPEEHAVFYFVRIRMVYRTYHGGVPSVLSVRFVILKFEKENLPDE
jgi:hypothetical protein